MVIFVGKLQFTANIFQRLRVSRDNHGMSNDVAIYSCDRTYIKDRIGNYIGVPSFP